MRTSSFLARLMLAWFVLFVCASVASPLIKPVDLEMVCSASGEMKLVALNSDEPVPLVHSQHLLDCPACLPLMAPPAHSFKLVPQSHEIAAVLSPVAAARIAALTAAPLPARGPPLPA